MMQQRQENRNPLKELLDLQPTALDGFLSYDYGLCSPRPLDKLQGVFSLWEKWAKDFPSLYQTGGYREYFADQPILSTSDLSDEDLLRANQILGLAAHATVHFSKAMDDDEKAPSDKLTQPQSKCPFASPSKPGTSTGEIQAPSKCPFAPPSKAALAITNANQEPSESNAKSECSIPPAIFKPWKEVNLRLGRPMPTFTYYDYFTLNVVPKDGAPRSCLWEPNAARTPRQTYAQLSTDVAVFGDATEDTFVLVNHDMEYQTTPLIRLCCDAVDCVLERDDEGLASILLEMGDVVKTVTYTFLQADPNANSANFVDPVGWSKSIGMLIPPILEGEFSMSGLQSSFVHLLDVFLGRYSFDGEIGTLALNERPWLPSLHQEFFKRLQIIPVRDYVCQSRSRVLRTSFDRLVRLFAAPHGSFLGAHRIKTMGFLELGMKTGRTESSGKTAQTSSAFGWQARVWQKVNQDLHEGIEERTRLQTNPAADGFCEAFVQSIEELGAVPGSESYRVTFNIAGSGLSYQAGDRIEVMPANSPEILQRMLKALGMSPVDLASSSLLVAAQTEEWKEAVAKSYEKLSDQTKFPIAALLRIMHLRPLTRAIFDSVCEAAGMSGCSLAEEKLRQGKIHDVPQLIELLRATQTGGAFSNEAIHDLPSKLCSFLPPLRPRLYSIANSPPPGTSPSVVSIVISRLFFEADDIVPEGNSEDFSGSQVLDDRSENFDLDCSYVRSSKSSRSSSMISCSTILEDFSESQVLDDKSESFDLDCSHVRSKQSRSSSMIPCKAGTGTIRHMGVCTSFLLNHSLYRYVPLRVVEEDSFRLPPVEDKNPIVLCALGSGVAPMLAFLEELLDRGVEKCPQIYFCWGLRYARNMFGISTLERAIEELGLKLCVTFSGEPKCVRVEAGKIQVVPGEPQDQQRITTAMTTGPWAEILARVVQQGTIFLCGHPQLETTIRGVLETALGTTGFSPKQSSDKYEQMVADKRIRADCFHSGSVHDPSLPGISFSEVARHNKMDDLWCIYKDHVYNLTEYLRLHPGGTKILFDKGGRDATEDFIVAHGPHNLRIESAALPYRVGNLEQPEFESFADKKAYKHAIKFLHKICEIRNVFFLDVNIFPGKQEASGIAHSPAMRFQTHEKFITSTVPMLERALSELCESLEGAIPNSRLVRMPRTHAARLTSLRKQLTPLLSKGSSPGILCNVATSLCRIESEFCDEFQSMAVNFVSSIESLDMKCRDAFAPLAKICDDILPALESQLHTTRVNAPLVLPKNFDIFRAPSTEDCEETQESEGSDFDESADFSRGLTIRHLEKEIFGRTDDGHGSALFEV